MVAGPFGPLETLTRGRGAPHTVFVHGLTGSIATTRPYAGRTPGTRTFAHIAGHGRSTRPAELSYPTLAREVWAVADDVQADAAVGISMGAGALCAGLSSDPDRFDAVVLALPASLDRPRVAMQEFTGLARLVQAADSEAVTAHLLAFEPADVADLPEVQRWCAEQAARLLAGSAAAALEALPHQVPVADAATLAAVEAPVLVIAQTDDEIHPVSVAEELAQVLPRARLEVFGAGGIIWAHRERVTTVVGDFLAEHTG
ncbi:MAG: alpha/beta fold hydrolase [Ornithinimicrobium sp.]